MEQNYKLVLLNDGRNILVSDELTNIQAQEIEHYQTYDRKFFRIIGGTERTPTLIYSDEVKQILRDKYGFVDTEELVKLSQSATDNLKFAGGEHEKLVAQMFFRKGFKTHQSITNKRFGLEELINNFKPQFDTFINNGGAIGSSEEWIQFQNIVEWFPKFLQSLQQPIELNVEVEMEEEFEGDFEHDEGGTLPGTVYTEFIPKITNNSIKVLKIIK